jgi:hypothetical protein
MAIRLGLLIELRPKARWLLRLGERRSPRPQRVVPRRRAPRERTVACTAGPRGDPSPSPSRDLAAEAPA